MAALAGLVKAADRAKRVSVAGGAATASSAASSAASAAGASSAAAAAGDLPACALSPAMVELSHDCSPCLLQVSDNPAAGLINTKRTAICLNQMAVLAADSCTDCCQTLNIFTHGRLLLYDAHVPLLRTCATRSNNPCLCCVRTYLPACAERWTDLKHVSHIQWYAGGAAAAAAAGGSSAASAASAGSAAAAAASGGMSQKQMPVLSFIMLSRWIASA